MRINRPHIGPGLREDKAVVPMMRTRINHPGMTQMHILQKPLVFQGHMGLDGVIPIRRLLRSEVELEPGEPVISRVGAEHW